MLYLHVPSHFFMKYHYKQGVFRYGLYGETYICNHPVYTSCTLFKKGDIGLGIIQQRYDAITKMTWWTEVDTWLIDEVFMHRRFTELFEKYAAAPINDIYPVLSIRQAMWRLRMKPLPRQPWETVFDSAPI